MDFGKRTFDKISESCTAAVSYMPTRPSFFMTKNLELFKNFQRIGLLKGYKFDLPNEITHNKLLYVVYITAKAQQFKCTYG